MDMLRNFGYKAQFLMLIGIMTFFMLLVEVFYYAQFMRVTHERESGYEQIIADEAQSRLEQMAALMRSTSSGIENTATVQNYIARQTSIEKKLMRDSLYDIISIVPSYNPYASGIMIADENGLTSTSAVSTVSVSWLYRQLEARYDGLLSISGDVITPVMLGNTPPSRPFICFIHPIRSPDGGRGARAKAVCVIVLELSRINVMIDATNRAGGSLFYLLDAYGEVIQAGGDGNEQITAAQLAGLASSAGDGGNSGGNSGGNGNGSGGGIGDAIGNGSSSAVDGNGGGEGADDGNGGGNGSGGGFDDGNGGGIGGEGGNGDGSRIRLGGVEYLAYTRLNSLIGWRTVSLTPVRAINAQLNAIQYMAAAIALLSITFCLATGFFFSSNMSRPLESLLADLRSIGETNMSRRISVRSRNEIGTITGAINGMLDKLQTMTANIFNMQDKMYESELRLKEAQLRSLQAQINPHFLYNTLDCVRGIALVEGVASIAAISEAMAGILRYATGGGLMSTVAAELESARSYSEIISVRFGGKIRFEFSVAPQILQLQIAKLVLQPIIENAVQHGLRDSEDGGLVAVGGFADGDCAVLEITDSGSGMDEALMARLNERFAGEGAVPSVGNGIVGAGNGAMPSAGVGAGGGAGLAAQSAPAGGHGIGLANINSRLRLFFGGASGVSVRRAVGGGTTVRLTVPARLSGDGAGADGIGAHGAGIGGTGSGSAKADGAGAHGAGGHGAGTDGTGSGSAKADGAGA
ncbi:MAG: histidine kinase, partial [Clostridiales bacterium]|nr:histidine kinase [Clostridiales bacterium]